MSRVSIGDFDMDPMDPAFVGCGVRYRVYIDPAGADDAVAFSRIFPDPDRGRDVGSATGLDSGRPRFEVPSNWSDAQSSAVAAAVAELLFDWRVDQAVSGLMFNDRRTWDGPADVQ